ncbi:MAG TPA: hypothetical protein VJN93_12075 [Candidatus Acidoferrum sp.]|nr:hypothetical protein [Candidatus Acidoferrum sp.]
MNSAHRQNDDDLRKLLKESLPPASPSELRRDLWPEMLAQLQRQPVHVPWFDWTLAALAAAALIVFPGIIPALLYHL